MGDSIVNSLKHLLLTTGYQAIDSLDFGYYEDTVHKDSGLYDIFDFLTSNATDDNCLENDCLQVVEKLKSENKFLDEVKTNKRLKCTSQLNALPTITEVDVDSCKSELFELQKQREVLQNIRDCLNIEFEELGKVLDINEQRKAKCDAILNRTINQCTELYSRYDSVHETANNSFKLLKKNLKDMSLNRKLEKNVLFQITDDASLRISSTVFKKSLLKLARKLGLPAEALLGTVENGLQSESTPVKNTADLNTSIQSKASTSFYNKIFSWDVYNKIVNIEEADPIVEFERNKSELKLFSVKLQQVAYRRTMKFIEKDSSSTVLELLGKMNSDIEAGALQFDVLKEDLQDMALGACDLPGGWGDENCTDELTTAVDVVCSEWMKSQMLKHLLKCLEQRAVRRENLLQQLNAFTNLLQTSLVVDDMLWMLLVTEKYCISTFIDIYKCTMSKSTSEIDGFKKRMKIMEKMLEKNSIEQPAESLNYYGEILFNEHDERMSINKISSAIDDSIESFHRIGSKFIEHMSRLSKLLDNRDKEILTFNKFKLTESGDFVLGDDEIENIQNKFDQLVENIETVGKLLDDKKKYFENKPYEKYYILAWALFLTNKEKVKEIAEEIEREARSLKGSSIS